MGGGGGSDVCVCVCVCVCVAGCWIETWHEIEPYESVNNYFKCCHAENPRWWSGNLGT